MYNLNIPTWMFLREKNVTAIAAYAVISGRCQACGKTFTDFEIGQLLDYTTKQLVCTFCEEEVLEDESSLPRADARTSLARFNSQVKPIFDLLQECEEIRLAPDLLEPEPTDFKKMQKYE